MAEAFSQSAKKENEFINAEALEFLERATDTKAEDELLKGITKNMDSRTKKNIIINNIINQIIKNKQFKKIGNNFVVDNEVLTEQQLQEQIIQKYRNEIITKLSIMESIIQSDVNITTNKIAINQLKQERIMEIETKKKMVNQWNQMSKNLNKQNRKLIDAVYKQGRIESAMQSQANQAMFQKHNISSKFMSIKHNFRMAMNKMNSQNIFNETRIHTAYQRRNMINHHNNKLNLKLLAIEQENADQQAKIELLKQRVKLLEKQLSENKALKDDLRQSIMNMINMIKTAGEKLRTKSKEEQEKFEQEFKKLATDFANELKAQSDINKDAFKKSMDDLIKQMDIDRDLEKKLQDLIISAIDKGNKIDLNIWNEQPPVVDPTTKMPAACGHNMPLGCLGNDWLENKNKFRNKTTGKRDITIFRCNYNGGGAHFCASDGNVGFWEDIEKRTLYEPY